MTKGLFRKRPGAFTRARMSQAARTSWTSGKRGYGKTRKRA